MAGDANGIISGTAMAVLVGFGSVIAALFTNNLSIGVRLVLLLLGVFFVWAGLRFSNG
jgi:Na+(H+)/acetate symporter ActP